MMSSKRRLFLHLRGISMINTFITSFKLKNTYKVNGIIYSLKQLPIIKKLLPSSLYGSRGLKTFANIMSGFMELGGIFLGKALYLLVCVFLPLGLLKADKGESFVHLCIFLSLAGGLLNTQLFNPTKDKYYAIVLMRMDAKKYTLANYYYFLLKIVIGFLPFSLIFGALSGVSLAICFMIPVFVAEVKVIFAALTLKKYTKTQKIKNENLPGPILWTLTALLLIAAYLPPYLGAALGEGVLVALLILGLIASIISLKYIRGFKDYKRIYKELLTENNLIFNSKSKVQEITKDTYLKKIDIDPIETSSKRGYKYFNELFVKRHRKILTKSAKRTAVIITVIIIITATLCIFNEDIREAVNGLMLTFLPYFLFLMYMINPGKNVTQAMFINCDSSMLSYRFYRQPKIILLLFTERLKSLILINMIPASVIALGLPILLYITGGTDNFLNYILLFTSIIAMSVFFSVHNLVMYYLLQPYNINIEVKSAAYSIISSVTYFICYFAIGKNIPTLTFGSLIIAFSVIYVAVALVLVYKFAPKTFKIRQ